MALKVFLVEDESVIREGLRDNIPWEQYGYRFVGEAADGEMALPLIRKERPDVVITDIKMPFMDGLSLSHIVKQEMPECRIIIISGYDDFEYARQAIAEGVEQYLLKPITRSTLQKALMEVKEKIDQAEEQKNYLRKYQSDMREYEQSFRRNFFEKAFQGQTPVTELYEEAAKHSLDINAPAYNIIFISVQTKENMIDASDSDCQEELMRYLLRFSEQCIVFRWSINVYGIVLKGEMDRVISQTNSFVEAMDEICKKYEREITWNIASGQPVERLSMLGECYKNVNHVFSYRFFSPQTHILTESIVDGIVPSGGDREIEKIDTDLVNPELLISFLKNGQIEEISDFTSNFVTGLSEALKSKIFWDYLILNIRFSVVNFLEEMDISSEEIAQRLPMEELKGMEISVANMNKYLKNNITVAIECRDKKTGSQGKKALKSALDYVEEHYAEESLSLNEVAQATKVSPNYFSAMFSQEMGQTFIEYVTQLRMDKAKALLLEGNVKSGDVGPMVGYKNPQYFSFVFKKTQGCSPREYRSANKE